MVAPFGRLSGGEPADLLNLQSNSSGLSVSVLTYGATVQSLKVPAAGRWVETVVGFDDIASYEGSSSYPGCIVGRLVNRVAGAAFRSGGRTYHLTANEGANCLHGGTRGLSRRVWQVLPRQDATDPIVMQYVSPDGEEGFPGTMRAAVSFALSDPMSLVVRYRATVDRDCPVDLTHHLYFNLGGLPVEDHWLKIAGERVQEVDAHYLATGKTLSVHGTPFDLRMGRTLAQVQAGQHPQLTAIGLNQNWIASARGAAAATLMSPDGALAMELHSDQPCLQVWAGLQRSVFAAGAVALEPQGYIDAVNHPALPSPWLRPGDVYERSTVYRFRPPTEHELTLESLERHALRCKIR